MNLKLKGKTMQKPEILTKEELMQEGNNNVPAVHHENALIGMIEKVATMDNVNTTVLKELMDLQERALDRNAKQAYMAAFAEMQPEIPEVSERAKSHNGKYASLEDINDAVKPILAKHGFGISFRVNQENNTIRVSGILSHREGHYESTEMIVPADNSGSKNAVQAIGSSVSYAKRYVLCALLNISTRGEDDDAGKASTGKACTEEQQEVLKEVLMGCSSATQEWFRGKYTSVANVPASSFTVLHEKLKKARASKATPKDE